MNRIDRLMGILTTLQSRKFTSAEYIAEKFEISIRTTYRDVKALSEIGIPVAHEPNKGYFIVQGYFFPPVSFTQQEANALILLETVAKKFGDKSIQQHYNSALNKIKSMLKTAEKEKADFVESFIPPLQVPFMGDGEHSYLTDIQDAITNKNIVKIAYKNSQEKESTREIEPIGLTFYGFHWHLLAWCWKRNDYRDFKVSRISNFSNTFQKFRKTDHPTVDEYIKNLQKD
jgi:predicted DNA-binding transcriptional regulator YafY